MYLEFTTNTKTGVSTPYVGQCELTCRSFNDKQSKKENPSYGK